MPTYRYPLANGKSIVLEGESEPTDADVETAARQAGVLSLLQRQPRQAPPTADPYARVRGMVAQLDDPRTFTAALSTAPLAGGAKLTGLGIRGAANVLEALPSIMKPSQRGLDMLRYAGHRLGGTWPRGLPSPMGGPRLIESMTRAAMRATTGPPGTAVRAQPLGTRLGKRLVLLPEEAQTAEALQQIATKRAAEQGMRTAAYGTKGFLR